MLITAGKLYVHRKSATGGSPLTRRSPGLPAPSRDAGTCTVRAVGIRSGAAGMAGGRRTAAQALILGASIHKHHISSSGRHFDPGPLQVPCLKPGSRGDDMP